MHIVFTVHEIPMLELQHEVSKYEFRNTNAAAD